MNGDEVVGVSLPTTFDIKIGHKARQTKYWWNFKKKKKKKTNRMH